MIDSSKNMNILIVGTGMYVTGRGTEEHGTILPAISSFQKVRDEPSKHGERVLLANDPQIEETQR